MIQFNLLPDSKLENVKTRSSERTILLVAVISSIAAASLLVLSILAVGVQKHSLSSADNDINRYEAQINQISGVNDILTIQNQLKTLVSLHKSEPAATRLFSYLPQITPTRASIGQLSIDFDAHTMTISGTANSLQSINEFADTLKFTVYKVGAQSTSKAAFTSVILSSFGRDPSGASYTFQLKFDPALFDASQNVTLSVPQNYITTRSFTQLPNSALFSGTGGSQ